MAVYSKLTGHRRSDEVVDTLRAIACLALVSFHVVGNSPAAGMELISDHWLSVVNRTFSDMRMPLFSFLSGLVFVSLDRTSRSSYALIGSKVRRLLLPMLSVGALFWMARDMMGQGQQPLATIAFMPFAHFWFLQATFLIMVTFIAISALSGGRSTLVAVGLMCFGASFWVFGILPKSNVFSVVQALYLAPFFMCGYLCGRVRLPKIHGVAAFVILSGLSGLGYLLATNFLVVDPTVRRAICVGSGLLFCATLLSIRPQNRMLASLGTMSYAIYLFHVFFTAGMRETMGHVWPQMPVALLWLVCMMVGILGPIALYHLITRNRLISFSLLGVKALDLPRRTPVPPAMKAIFGKA